MEQRELKIISTVFTRRRNIWTSHADHSKHQDELGQDEDQEMKLASATPEQPCTNKQKGELFSYTRFGQFKIPYCYLTKY